jgi:hypothetical protein
LFVSSNYIQHTESERSSDAIRVTEEMEPNVIVYPAQHGIRKHGRWNSRPRHVKRKSKIFKKIPATLRRFLFSIIKTN